ncbi:MAG: amino acid adenylation domain-containing protein [Bacteroidia bacterium]
MISGFISNYHKTPDNPALIINDKIYSYRELFLIASEISSTLKQDEKLIGVYTDYSVYTYASIIAVLLKGAGFVPINKKFPKDKLINIIKSSGIKTILCNSGSVSGLEEMKEECNFEISINDQSSSDKNIQAESGKQPVNSKESDIAYILFTSGSTGIPKGIGITHKNFRSFIKAMTRSGNYEFNSSDVFLQIFELSFDVSIACIFIAWEAGASLVPVSTEGIVFIEALEIMKKYNVSVASMAPSAVAYMKQLRLLEEFNFPNLKYTFLTGEALPYNLAIAWKEVAPGSIIENAYGPTEVTVWSSMYRLNEQTPDEIINGLVPIGKVLDGLTYKVCDEKLNGVKAGEFGELLLYGDQVAAGYWNDPVKTATNFVKINSGKYPGNWYRTGDIVVENSYGNLMYINRMDNQVQINGFRVELGEIEFRIKEYTKKDSAVVLAYQNANNTITLIGFVENMTNELNSLKSHLSSTLPHYMVPKKFYNIDAMPLNNSGKIDRKKLMELHTED